MTPLRHLRMLDLSRQLPGPFCSTVLADLGVDVLTVGMPNDPFGGGIPFLGRNKRSMTLNLKSDEGRDVFHRLVADVDIVLEGFRPGVTARLGIDYATLSAKHPRLIYCSISGYGQDGPYRDRVGHDLNYLGFAGVLNYLTHSDSPPIVPGVQIADIGGGALMAVIGILTAAIAREKTGRGQYIDIGMMDGAVAWNVYHLLLYQLAGTLPKRGAEQMTGHHACFNVYETRDGRYVTVGAYEGHFWATLCRHFGREDYIACQWDAGEKRVEMLDFFRAAFREKTLAEWMAELGEKEICFGPVSTLDEMVLDPQVRHRQMIVDIETPAGPMRGTGTPIKLSDTPASIRTPPPAYGQHTEAELSRLGYDAAAIARMRQAKIV